MKVSRERVNWEPPTLCSMREKTDRLGRAGEMVDSATRITADRRVARTARNLQSNHCSRAL